VTSPATVRVHAGSGPTLIYLPGLHGDWGLIGAFRRALGGRVRFVEISYPNAPVALDALAAGVEAALREHAIDSGWLLAQSFGSQVGWELLRRGFRADGVILAGGFVRHPWPWGVGLMRAFLSRVPAGLIGGPYRALTALGSAVSRREPETADELAAFARGRTAEHWRAAAWRLTLIAASDPRETARGARVPVHYLGGLIDPLVPWPAVTGWLGRECPAYKGRAILPFADHNVLGSAPRESAERVLGWVAG
jgi:pimeloyl-ACP methyl ester carboxylesterase